MLTLQIAVGIWMGGLLLCASVWAACTLNDRIEKNRRFGYAWWRGLVW